MYGKIEIKLKRWQQFSTNCLNGCLHCVHGYTFYAHKCFVCTNYRLAQCRIYWRQLIFDVQKIIIEGFFSFVLRQSGLCLCVLCCGKMVTMVVFVLVHVVAAQQQPTLPPKYNRHIFLPCTRIIFVSVSQSVCRQQHIKN